VPFTPPAAIGPAHDVSHFQCTHAELTDWLQRKSLANEIAQASRTFVVCEGRRVVGYYALAAGSIEHAASPGSIRRNMPAPIPAIVLGRLAVDGRYLGRGLGAGLLQDAIQRSLGAALAIGARVLLCHAVDQRARAFYLGHGFSPSAIEDMTLLLDLAKVGALISPPVRRK
jgi:GNAT superfamily N-acetyltransferase